MLPGLVLLALVSMSWPPGQRDAAAGARAGTIAGRITDRESGRPLPGTIVALAGAGTAQPTETVADADGRYEFSGLDAGRYAVWARPDQHRSTHLPQAAGQPAPLDLLAGRPPRTIELKLAERLAGVDLALGRALAIDGRVIDQSDEPMADVNVMAIHADGEGVPSAIAISDDRGEFRLFGLAPGIYRVCAEPDKAPVDSSPEPARYARTCHPASIVDAHAAEVPLATRDAVGIDIRAQGIRSHTVSGSVIDATGTAVQGAYVTAVPLDETAASAQTKTQTGAFVLSGLTPGRYLLQSSIGGSMRGDVNPPSRDRETGFTSIEVMNGDINGVAITLTKAVTLNGRIRFDGDPPTNAKGLRMMVQTRQAVVLAQSIMERPPFSPIDDQLRFQLPGVYRLPLVVGLSGLPQGWAIKAVRYDGRDITNVPVDFAGSGSRALEIVVTNRVAEPSIKVGDDHGNAVETFQVLVLSPNPEAWKQGPLPVAGQPSSDGLMKLGALLPGEYLLVALPLRSYANVWRDRDLVERLAPLATRLTFAAGDRRTYELRLVKVPQ